MLGNAMRIEVLADPEAVARHAAALIAEEARATVAARGRFVLAVSGGRTPWQMLRALAAETVPWAGVHVIQVDERGQQQSLLVPGANRLMRVQDVHAARETITCSRVLLMQLEVPIECVMAARTAWRTARWPCRS